MGFPFNEWLAECQGPSADTWVISTAHSLTFPRTVPQALSNGTSLPVSEGLSLRLVCMADGNPAASMGWFRGHEALPSSRASESGVLELPEVQAKDQGELTCWARHLLGSRHFSLSLSVQSECQGRCVLQSSGDGGG